MNLKLRRYERKDIPEMVRVAMENIPKLPNYAGMKPDRARLEFLLGNNLTNSGSFTAFILADEDDVPAGAILAYCTMMYFSWDMFAGDIFLYIKPEHRTLPNAILLIKAYTDWAIARGAKLIAATHTGGINDEAMGRLLRTVGFEPVGKLYHYRRK